MEDQFHEEGEFHGGSEEFNGESEEFNGESEEFNGGSEEFYEEFNGIFNGVLNELCNGRRNNEVTKNTNCNENTGDVDCNDEITRAVEENFNREVEEFSKSILKNAIKEDTPLDDYILIGSGLKNPMTDNQYQEYIKKHLSESPCLLSKLDDFDSGACSFFESL
jgi:hypothetical protein